MAVTTALKPDRPFLWIAVGMIVHALAILAVWIVTFRFDIELMPARVWLAGAWAWLFWPLAMVLNPARFRMALLVPLGVALVLLWPCLGTIYTFTVWSITGFAP